MKRSKLVAVVAITAAIVASSTSAAVALVVTSKDIKDRTIQGKDIKANAVRRSELASAVRHDIDAAYEVAAAARIYVDSEAANYGTLPRAYSVVGATPTITSGGADGNGGATFVLNVPGLGAAATTLGAKVFAIATASAVEQGNSSTIPSVSVNWSDGDFASVTATKNGDFTIDVVFFYL